MDGLTKLATEIGHARDYGQMASATARKLLDIVAELNAQRMAALEEQANDIWAVVAKHYVELPKDADGEYIHVGDVLQSKRCNGGWCEPYEVYRMSLGEDGWSVCEANGCGHLPNLCRHKPPTTEDVLTEFALACEDAGNAGPEVERLAAEYAKRLTLREEVDQ